MTISSAFAAAPALAPSFPTAAPDRAAALLSVARTLLPILEAGRSVDAPVLRSAMADAFGASDAEGAWGWKDAYEACEAALVLFVQRYGPALRARPAATQLAMLAKVAGLLPSQTRRSEESQAFQQFSTPVTLGLAAARAAMIVPGDLVLEPSAGTGLLAALAQAARANLALNEIADLRAALLGQLFASFPVSRHDAAHIHDHLDPNIRPTIVLMNPPFSVGAHVEGRVADAAMRHVGSALARLAEGGRLVTITGASLWRRLPQDGCRVYRLQTNDGERVIGRRVSAQWVADALGSTAPAIAAGDAWAAVLERGATLQLEGDMTVRRSRVMNAERIELAGFTDGMVERLKATGLTSEIIAWRLRLFVPVGANGPAILGRLLERHPICRVTDRAAA